MLVNKIRNPQAFSPKPNTRKNKISLQITQPWVQALVQPSCQSFLVPHQSLANPSRLHFHVKHSSVVGILDISLAFRWYQKTNWTTVGHILNTSYVLIHYTPTQKNQQDSYVTTTMVQSRRLRKSEVKQRTPCSRRQISRAHTFSLVFSLTGELFYHSSEHFIEVTGCGSSYMPCARPRAPSLMSLCMHIDAQRQSHWAWSHLLSPNQLLPIWAPGAMGCLSIHTLPSQQPQWLLGYHISTVSHPSLDMNL